MIYKLVLLSYLCILFFSCTEKEDFDLKEKNQNNIRKKEYISANIRLNTDTTTYPINSLNDLINTLDTNTIESIKIHRFIEPNLSYRMPITRASVQQFTAVGSTVDFQDISNKHYIKMKISKEMADFLNSQYENLTYLFKEATYICCWQYQTQTISLKNNEVFGASESPLCGLHPATYTQIQSCIRGYESYQNYPSQITMVTYCVRFHCLDTKKTTPILDIIYPDPWQKPHNTKDPGYRYNYSVLTI